MTKLDGKIAVVTGASRGIGKIIALILAESGAQVACLATSEENARPTAEQARAYGQRAIALGCRVENPESVTKTFAEIENRLGPVEILVNNAGISEPVATLNMSVENWDRHMDINAKSVFLCSQAAARQMKEHDGGTIINISSIVAENAYPATLGYCASKATVNQMTRVLAIEWAKYGIRVNAIAPGYIRTDLVEGLVAEGKLSLDALEKRTPQRRLGPAEDIAKACVYLAAGESDFMTGSIMTLDGGWSAYGYF